MSQRQTRMTRGAAYLVLLAIVACSSNTPTATSSKRVTTSVKATTKPATTSKAAGSTAGLPSGAASPSTNGAGTGNQGDDTSSGAASPGTGTGDASSAPSNVPSALGSTSGTSASPDGTGTGTAPASPGSSTLGSATPSASPSPSPPPSPPPSPTPIPSVAVTPVASLAPTANLMVSTVAGDDLPTLTDGAGGDNDSAEFNRPRGLVVDPSGNLFVADSGNNCIRKIDFSSGTPMVTTVAGDQGTRVQGNTDDPDPMRAKFNNPSGLALAPNGDLYIADTGNHRIRKLAAGGGVTTVAGSSLGNKDDAGTKAQFNFPTGLAWDGTALYVADSGNSLIRKIDFSDPADPVSTIAGSVKLGAGMANNADSTKAQFNTPYALGVDSKHMLYVLDASNHRIRKVDLTSKTYGVTTFAGPADSTVPGNGFADSPSPQFDFSADGGLCVTPDGSVYVADATNKRIRHIAPDGTVATLAGDGASTRTKQGSFSADGAAATAEFALPIGIAISSDGKLYVADTSDYRIRLIK